MPPEFMESSPESDITAMDFNNTELTLRLPGDAPSSTLIGRCSCMKRGYFETVDLNIGCSGSLLRGEARATDDESESEASSTGKSPAAKAQAVGWPPVRWYRKKAMESCTTTSYVKVAVDGAPYLRKVDLEAYSGYQDLLMALQEMFTCLVNKTRKSSVVEERKVVDMMKKGIEEEYVYVPTYQDKDGDWMLVGDVPWKMFKESCKRIRFMKSSKSLEIAQEISSKCKRPGSKPF